LPPGVVGAPAIAGVSTGANVAAFSSIPTVCCSSYMLKNKTYETNGLSDYDNLSDSFFCNWTIAYRNAENRTGELDKLSDYWISKILGLPTALDAVIPNPSLYLSRKGGLH
jgi:hypothetical protein